MRLPKNPTVKSTLAGVALFLALMVAACGSSASVDMHGVWELESYRDGVRTHPVVVGDTAPQIQPWVELREDGLVGDSGCRPFHLPWSLDRSRLVRDTSVEIWANTYACPSSSGGPSTDDVFFWNLLFDGDRPIRVEVDGDRMTWTRGLVRLDFVSSSSQPTTTTAPPPTRYGPVDCAPGAVVESDIPDTSQDPVDLVRSLDPSVVEVRGEFPDWLGYDADGRVVAMVYAMDVTPPTYRAVVCDR